MLALILVWSVVWWNAQNQWISFTYQAQHGSGSAWQVTHVLGFLLMQILTYGFLLLWGVAGWLQVKRCNLRLMVVFFVVPFGVLATLWPVAALAYRTGQHLPGLLWHR